jgi:hypothetical protein
MIRSPGNGTQDAEYCTEITLVRYEFEGFIHSAVCVWCCALTPESSLEHIPTGKLLGTTRFWTADRKMVWVWRTAPQAKHNSKTADIHAVDRV